MDTNSLTTAGCVLAFSVLVVGVLVLRALYRIADLNTSIDSLNYHCRCLSDNMQSMDRRHERELGSYKTTLTDLHHSAEKATSYIKKIQELASKIDKVDMDLTNRIDALCSLCENVDARNAILTKRLDAQQRIDFERAYMDAVRSQIEQMSRDTLQSKPPIDQVPNPGE